MKREKGSFITDLVAGGISATISKTVMAPIERVKLLLQTQHVNKMLENQYSGLTDCIVRVYREQGLLSFWRGNSANIIRFFPNHALNFALKDKFKLFFVGGATKESNFVRFFMGNLLSGGAAGAVALTFTHPLDIMRTKLAADVGANSTHRQYNTYYACAKDIYHISGIYGFYRGFVMSLFGVITFKALFLGGYDIMKAYLHIEKPLKDPSNSLNPASNLGKDPPSSSSRSMSGWNNLGARFIMAQVLTSVVGGVCYPLDTIRRRIMMQVHTNGIFLYNNSIHCALQIWKYEGIRGFYHGFSANLIRSFGGAILLVGYDEVKSLIEYFLHIRAS